MRASPWSSERVSRVVTALWFAAITLIVGAALMVVVLGTGRLPVPGWVVLVAPAPIALIVVAVREGPAAAVAILRTRTRIRARPRWYLVALAIAPAAAALALLIDGQYSGAPVALRAPSATELVLLAAAVISVEYAFRGVLTARLLESMRPLTAAVVSGAVWFAWCLPVLGAAGPVVDSIRWLTGLLIFSASVLLTWIYRRTLSIIPTTVCHLSGAVVLLILPLAPRTGGRPVAFGLFVFLITVSALGVAIALTGHDRPHASS